MKVRQRRRFHSALGSPRAFFLCRYNRIVAAVLEFEGISKRYRSFLGREHWALSDFSLKMERGEIVGFAQALINDPELLILDEPTSALDPLSRLKVRELLLQHRTGGKSIFLSSHQLSEVERICDRVIFVQKGRVIASGRTQDLLKESDEFEITASGLRSAPPETRNSHTENGHLVFSTTAAQQRSAIEQVWSAGGTVISVVPKTRTMEELFVELMTNSEFG